MAAELGSVLNGILSEMTKPERKFAGFGEHWHRIGSVEWIKSHISEREGLQAGFRREDLIGNDRLTGLRTRPGASVLMKHKKKVHSPNAARDNVKRTVAAMDRVGSGTFDGFSLLGLATTK